MVVDASGARGRGEVGAGHWGRGVDDVNEAAVVRSAVGAATVPARRHPEASADFLAPLAAVIVDVRVHRQHLHEVDIAATSTAAETVHALLPCADLFGLVDAEVVAGLHASGHVGHVDPQVLAGVAVD